MMTKDKHININSSSVEIKQQLIMYFSDESDNREAAFFINDSPLYKWYELSIKLKSIFGISTRTMITAEYDCCFTYKPTIRNEIINCLDDATKIFAALCFEHDCFFTNSYDDVLFTCIKLFEIWRNDIDDESRKTLKKITKTNDIEKLAIELKCFGKREGIKDVVDAYYAGVPIDDLIKQNHMFTSLIY